MILIKNNYFLEDWWNKKDIDFEEKGIKLGIR